MIRPATPDDMSDIVRLAHSFFASASVGHHIDSDTVSIIATAEHLMNAGNSCLLLAEVDGDVIGMAGATVYPFHFNMNYTVGHELLWWVEAEHRGVGAGPKLFQAMEQWAKDKGATYMIMASQPNLDGNRTARFFERNGYTPIDQNFMRPLERRH